MITTLGVVIRERSVGDNDKFIDILTAEHGILEACVKGAKKINGKNSSATQLFAYSNFCLSDGKKGYIVNSTEIKKSFYDLRLDIVNLSLASYFSEVIKYCVLTGENSVNILRLFLNCLHFLCENNKNPIILKSIFELRLLCENGFMPHIVACEKCAKFEDEFIYFDIKEGNFYCSDCYNLTLENVNAVKVKKSVLQGLRHITFSEFDKLFNFTLNEENINILNEITEKYLLTHLHRKFKTLDFLKQLL